MISEASRWTGASSDSPSSEHRLGATLATCAACPMTAEELARQDIDRQLAQCVWQVQRRNEMNIFASPGVAVREFVMLTGEGDYLLYVGGTAIGVVEPKP
jgi:type I site-specific restriction endonuclease